MLAVYAFTLISRHMAKYTASNVDEMFFNNRTGGFIAACLGWAVGRVHRLCEGKVAADNSAEWSHFFIVRLYSMGNINFIQSIVSLCL